MIEPLTLAIGIGLVICLVFSELLGLSVGGLVVPGYLALNLDQPISVLLTIAIAFVAYGSINFLSTFMILFGRRRIVLTVLIAFILGAFFRDVLNQDINLVLGAGHMFAVIGYIIPGLIAIAIDREGILESMTMMLTASVVVRLILIVLLGGQLIT